MRRIDHPVLSLGELLLVPLAEYHVVRLRIFLNEVVIHFVKTDFISCAIRTVFAFTPVEILPLDAVALAFILVDLERFLVFSCNLVQSLQWRSNLDHNVGSCRWYVLYFGLQSHFLFQEFYQHQDVKGLHLLQSRLNLGLVRYILLFDEFSAPFSGSWLICFNGYGWVLRGHGWFFDGR